MDNNKLKVAVIGTEGSGKTVLITCLAKYLEGGGRNGYILVPTTKQTPLYVEKNWRALNGGEWPPANNSGEFIDLQWNLRVTAGDSRAERQYALRIVDCSGHDLRQFFADGQIDNPTSLPPDLTPLIDFCNDAEVVLICANLDDFMSETDVERTTANQWGLKYAMDYKLKKQPNTRCALIFTQSHRYADVPAQFGSWDAVTAKFLPLVYSSHISSGKIPVLAMTAVNKVRQVPDESGKSRTLPGDDFGNDGFNELVNWLVDSAKQGNLQILEEKLAALDGRIQDARQRIQDEKLSVAEKVKDMRAGCLPGGCVLAIVIYVCLVIIIPILGLIFKESPPFGLVLLLGIAVAIFIMINNQKQKATADDRVMVAKLVQEREFLKAEIEKAG